MTTQNKNVTGQMYQTQVDCCNPGTNPSGKEHHIPQPSVLRLDISSILQQWCHCQHPPCNSNNVVFCSLEQIFPLLFTFSAECCSLPCRQRFISMITFPRQEWVLAVVLVVVVVVVVIFVWRSCEAVAIARKAEKGKLYSHDQGTKMEQMQCS